MPEYLTTRELAALLRIKERKVYDLAASGEVPCARVTGKLLFPDAEVRAWIERGRGKAAPRASRETMQGRPRSRPPVFLGSHDPLLERSLRDSRCGLATLLDGSLDGLERFAAGEGVACGMHVRAPLGGGCRDDGNGSGDGDETGPGDGNDLEAAWNVAAIESRGDVADAVLLRFATRRRGLVTAPDALVETLADARAQRLVTRQPESGAQTLYEQLVAEARLDGAGAGGPAARSEADAVLAVARGEADVAFGLQCLAVEYGLRFVPLVQERFDVLVDRRAWFEPPLQALCAHWRSAAFARRAQALPGHDVARLGEVAWNA